MIEQKALTKIIETQLDEINSLKEEIKKMIEGAELSEGLFLKVEKGVSKLREENRILRKCIEFYSNPESYDRGLGTYGTIADEDLEHISYNQEQILCGGKLARKTLDKL